jgi:hypothetical protein
MKDSWDDEFPLCGEIKFMFQTNNQVGFIEDISTVTLATMCPPKYKLVYKHH